MTATAAKADYNADAIVAAPFATNRTMANVNVLWVDIDFELHCTTIASAVRHDFAF